MINLTVVDDSTYLGSCGATRGGSSPLIRTSYVNDFQLIPDSRLKKYA